MGKSAGLPSGKHRHGDLVGLAESGDRLVYGLPAVVGVDGATRLIRDGQRLRVGQAAAS